jgi:hypothetical protein
MDKDLIQKFAPRRNKRHQHLRDYNDEAEWPDTLDWKNYTYFIKQVVPWFSFTSAGRSAVGRLDRITFGF